MFFLFAKIWCCVVGVAGLWLSPRLGRLNGFEPVVLDVSLCAEPELFLKGFVWDVVKSTMLLAAATTRGQLNRLAVHGVDSFAFCR